MRHEVITSASVSQVPCIVHACFYPKRQARAKEAIPKKKSVAPYPIYVVSS